MKNIQFEQVLALKKAVQDAFSVNVHFHDMCSYSAFSLDEPNEKIRAFIEDYFKKQNSRAVFNDSGTDFVIE